ncbi:MAG: hypothetical protein O2960_19155 [Verrucomicrobia bacterium]|nr:hypothetical protein [Verrucomicrobiota bacterium]
MSKAGTPYVAKGDGEVNNTDMQAYEEVADFIARRDPGEVAEFRPSVQARRRVFELLEKEKSTGLDSRERRELDHYEDLELLMNLAKARARHLLLHEP